MLKKFDNQHVTLHKSLVWILISLASSSAYADSCIGGGLTTIASAETDQCTLATGESVVVSAGNSVITTAVSAVTVLNGAGSISNSGTLEGNQRGVFVEAATLTGSLVNNASSNIRTSGAGSAEAAIWLNNGGHITGTLSNSGNISNTASNAITVFLNSSVGGGITNNVGGTIAGQGSGLYIVNSSTIGGTGITNAGSITAVSSGQAGIRLIGSTINGGITNSGTISGGALANGIEVRDFTGHGTSTVNGGIVNNTGGLIDGVYGIYVHQATAQGNSVINDGITNSAGATIRGSTAAVSLNPKTTTAMVIANSGLIDGAVILSDNTLNLEGALSRVTGLVTGSAGSTVNVIGTFTTEENFTGITNFGVAASGILNLHNGGNMTTTTMTNAGALVVAAGDSAMITGDYTQSAAGSLRFGVSSDVNYGQITISGTAILASNAKIDVNVTDPNFNFTTAFTNGMADVISAGTLTSDGTFVVTDNSLLFNFGAVKDGNTVDLTLGSAIPAAAVSTANQGKTAGAGAAVVIDDIILTNPTGALAANFIGLTTEQEVANAVESILPGISGGIAQVTNTSTNAVTDAIAERQDVARGISTGDIMMADRHFWLKPFGNWIEQGERQGVTGYDINSYGLALGFDRDVSSSWNMGFALAFINSDVVSNLEQGAHNITLDSYQAKIYSSKMLDDVTALNLQAGVGVSNYDSNRRLFNNSVANADYDSWNVQLSAELERSYQASKDTVVTPYIHANYGYVDVESYSEAGAGALNLNVSDDSSDSLILGTGMKVNRSVSSNLLLTANVGVAYDVLTARSNLTSSFSGGGASYTTEGIEPDEFVYNAGFGAKYSLKNGTEFTVAYNVDGRQDYTDQSVSVNFRLPF